MTNLSQCPNTLRTIDADTLMTTPLSTPGYIVDQLLPQGLHILAGAPKIGKSWLALWLCLQVAKGEPVWTFPTSPGTVLYLCLEDSYARIQRRLFLLTEDAPPTLHFANLSGLIGNGLEEQIRGFLRAHPETVLVVIDTLQKVRGPSADYNAYASDYRDVSALKQLADNHGIAILLIHHLRKMNVEDPLNMISGTTGLSGATDSSYVLRPAKRGSDIATLYCAGRDIEYRELSLRFEKDTHTWLLADPVHHEQPAIDPALISLSVFLKELCVYDGTATELSSLLAQRTGEQLLPSVLSKRLVRYAGELDKLGIRIAVSRTRDSRQLHIRYQPCDGSDGSDGKISAPDLLSQPSHLSQPVNKAL